MPKKIFGRGSNYGTMYRELLTGLKQDKQAELLKKKRISMANIEIFIDNESTHYNIYSDKNPQEHTLIYDIRRMQQLLSNAEVKKFHLVDTKVQLADIFTKNTKPSNDFTRAVFDGFMDVSCKCCYVSPKTGLMTGVVGREDAHDGYDTGHDSAVPGGSEDEQQEGAWGQGQAGEASD